MARKRGKEAVSESRAKVDESQWEDWRELREELGRRLGGRATTGLSDPEVLDAARLAQGKRRR